MPNSVARHQTTLGFADALVPGKNSSDQLGDEKVAVIDIGSNSVRMVVFADSNPVPNVVFNEKIMSGLGRSLLNTGRLDPDGIQSALVNLGRFSYLLNEMEIQEVRVVATAAVREADDGQQFVDLVRRQTGLSVDVLDGVQEAHYSALGVVSAWPNISGVMGDLGGGSLELVWINNGVPKDSTTLPLGPLRLQDAGSADRKELAALIETELDKVGWLNRKRHQNFIAVGGAWRSFARVHMAQFHHPLAVVHGYRLSGTDAQDFSKVVANLTPLSLRSISGVSRRRIDTMPEATMVLRACLARLLPKQVLFSANGLREGVVHAVGRRNGLTRDPLAFFCEREARQVSRFPEHGREIADWISPLFGKESSAEKQLRLCACLLSDLGWRHHPDRRAEQTFLEVVHMPGLPLFHDDRIFLALAVYNRYTHKGETQAVKVLTDRLGEDRKQRAYVIGTAARLAHTLSGGAPDVLGKIALKKTARNLVLEPDIGATDLIGEVVEKRFETLAGLIDRAPIIKN